MIIGHSVPLKLLEAALNNNQHHGFLLCGSKGIGKASAVQELAISVLAKASSFNFSIVKQQCLSGAYPNYFYITQAIDDDGKIKNDITIEQIRSLLNSLKKKAAVDGPRIVIIDSVDSLNRNAANALLKMLEEPPQNAFFLLICHGLGSVLPTVRSRCLVVNFNPLSNDDMAKIIGQNIDVSILSMASGAPGIYKKIIESGGGATITALQKLLMLTNLNDLKSAVQELLKQSDDNFLGYLLHQFLYQQSLKNPQVYAHSAQVVERFFRYTNNTHLDATHRLQAAVLLAQNPVQSALIFPQ